jgi:hypothetical protein
VMFFRRHAELVIAVAALCLAVAGALVGCRTTHLGHNTGEAYRAALEAQRTADTPGGGPELSAEDARMVLQVHRTGEAKGAASGASGPGLGAVPGLLPGGGTAGSWPGAEGGINPEDK